MTVQKYHLVSFPRMSVLFCPFVKMSVVLKRFFFQRFDRRRTSQIEKKIGLAIVEARDFEYKGNQIIHSWSEKCYSSLASLIDLEAPKRRAYVESVWKTNLVVCCWRWTLKLLLRSLHSLVHVLFVLFSQPASIKRFDWSIPHGRGSRLKRKKDPQKTGATIVQTIKTLYLLERAK